MSTETLTQTITDTCNSQIKNLSSLLETRRAVLNDVSKQVLQLEAEIYMYKSIIEAIENYEAPF